MLRTFAATAVVFAAAAAAAQPAQPPDAAAPPTRLFISPAGEPFRGPMDGPYPSGDWFRKADADADGALTLKEFDADAARFFDVLDANKDGRIDSRETQAYESDVAPEILPRVRPMGAEPSFEERMRMKRLRGGPPQGAAARRKGKTAPTGPRGAGIYGLLNEPQPVAAADGDFNTLITRDEWSSAAQRRFARLDANADRSLRLDELPKTPIQALDEEEQETPRRRLF